MILNLLSHSLVHTSVKAANVVRQRLGSSREERSLWTTLLAARLQEAEVLVAGYLRPDDDAARMIGRRLGGWAFHR